MSIVIGLEVLDQADVDEDGHLHLARFCGQVGAVRLQCVLVRRYRPDGISRGLRVKLPEGASVAKNALRSLKDEAAEAYRLAVERQM